MIKKKVFVFYYEWKSTEGNHAGMAYLVRAFEHQFQGKVVLIKEPSYQKEKNSLKKLWLKRCWLLLTILRLSLLSGKSDEIFFTEYGGIGWQTTVSRLMRFTRPRVRRTALIHLPLQVLKDFYGSERKLKKVLNRVNRILVFGSSLKRELKELSIDPQVDQTFHYVDDYYRSDDKRPVTAGPLQVLFVGNLMRNYTLLQAVIAGVNSSQITFHICGGAYNLEETFSKFSHVKIYAYMEEAELLLLMQKAEVSLNIFDDTIGSNVITTSLACGLPLVASDVGSIRDYADDTCAILCENKAAAFIDALTRLEQDRGLLRQKSKRATERAADFLLKNSLHFFNDYFQLN